MIDFPLLVRQLERPDSEVIGSRKYLLAQINAPFKDVSRTVRLDILQLLTGRRILSSSDISCGEAYGITRVIYAGKTIKPAFEIWIKEYDTRMQSLTYKRNKIRNEMFFMRGKMCELCGKNRATDMHEIINRDRTVGNETARLISYSPELCTLLCRECHTQVHTPDMQQYLLRMNLRRYEAANHEDNPVVKKYNELAAALSHLDIPLPGCHPATCPHCNKIDNYPDEKCHYCGGDYDI